MKAKVFKWALVILNLILLISASNILLKGGNSSPSIEVGIEFMFMWFFRILSIVLLILSVLHYSDKKKKITLLHTAIFSITLLITFL